MPTCLTGGQGVTLLYCIVITYPCTHCCCLESVEKWASSSNKSLRDKLHTHTHSQHPRFCLNNLSVQFLSSPETWRIWRGPFPPHLWFRLELTPSPFSVPCDRLEETTGNELAWDWAVLKRLPVICMKTSWRISLSPVTSTGSFTLCCCRSQGLPKAFLT